MAIDLQWALELLARRNYCRVTERVRQAVVALATSVRESMREHDLRLLDVQGYGRLVAEERTHWCGDRISDTWASLRSCEYDQEHDDWRSGGNLCLLEDEDNWYAAGCRIIPSKDPAASRDEVLEFALHLDNTLDALQKAVEAREDKADRAVAVVAVRDE